MTIEHLEQPLQRPLEAEVAAAVRRLLQDGLDGHVLVFSCPAPRRFAAPPAACAELAARAELDVVALHGDLPAAQQDRAGGAERASQARAQPPTSPRPRSPSMEWWR